jgi:hypothetical protein
MGRPRALSDLSALSHGLWESSHHLQLRDDAKCGIATDEFTEIVQQSPQRVHDTHALPIVLRDF